MPYKTLRSFKEELERADRLKHVAADVDKQGELACIARWVIECVESSEMYALQFDHVRGHRDPVVVGLFSTRELYAKALGVTPDRILECWTNAMQNPLSWEVVRDAPTMELVHVGHEVDLTCLPIPVWTPGRDAGPYIPSAAVITKDRDTGIQNLGVYRVQVHNGRLAGIFFGSEKQHGAIHYAKYTDANEPMPIALVIGAAPVVNFAASAKTSYGVDELHIAGGLAGEPLSVIHGKTVDLFVPADAEYVIEGLVYPQPRKVEAPFGEGMGWMNTAAPAPVIEISAICQRKSPFFHGYVQQLPPSEGHLVWELGSLGPLFYYLRNQLGFGFVTDLAVVPGAAGLAMLALQIQRGSPQREVQRLFSTLSTINFGQKFVTIVDQDIDVHDGETLQWAISTRVDPQRDVRVIENVKTYLADPAVIARNQPNGEQLSGGPFLSSMMLIDATLKCRVPEIALPGEQLMLQVLERWRDFKLPGIRERGRLRRLLAEHTDDDLYYEHHP